MIISIYGKNRSGKTTLANMLESEYDFVRISFSDALRKIAESFFGITTDWKTDDKWSVDSSYNYNLDRLFSIVKDKNNVKQLIVNKIKQVRTKREAYRVTMELLGTDVFRNMVLKDIWIAILVFKIFRHSGNGHNLVVDDMRFDDEYCMLDNLNTVFIKIKSPFEEPVGEHESQQYVSGFEPNYAINNNGSKKELLEKFKSLNIVWDK